mgnify:CR=1 FL=1
MDIEGDMILFILLVLVFYAGVTWYYLRKTKHVKLKDKFAKFDRTVLDKSSEVIFTGAFILFVLVFVYGVFSKGRQMVRNKMR